jgi:tetratricopeptide (TPR) repeat protein
MAGIHHRLPRFVALAALLVYGLTLSWGTTLNSLPMAAKVAGWDWQPMANEPLTWLLTLPLRCLPAGWIPVSLNLFFAICGALTLGLLARSIELLPWDCPPDENKKWIKPLPVLLACAVCGLEFNFWQEATAAAGVMLNQLLLAAAIWCLLEYRAGKELRWLKTAALIWGLGMAENWVMLLNLPLFVAALIWLRQWRFFKWDFLLRMALLGLAGFSIYALLPLVNGLNPHSPWSFGEAWLAPLKITRNTFFALYVEFWARHRLMTVAVLLYFLMPTLPCLVRLQDRGANNQSKVEQFQMWIYRVSRVGLLLACLWLAFDPSIGPQQILLRQFGISLPLLSFDYLNALGIGFLAGNLLFVSQIIPERRRRGLSGKINSWLQHSAPTILAIASGLIIVGLVARNAPAILLANRQPLENFGELAVSSLPAGGGIVLGDDASKLAVFQAALSHKSEGRRWLAVDSRSLPLPEYRAALERRQPLGWLTAQNRQELKPLEMLHLLNQLAQTNHIFYLQPSPGHYFFEEFYPQSHSAVAELKFYEKNQASGPPLSPPAVVAGEKFWDDAWQKKMEPVSQPGPQRPSAWVKISGKLFRRFCLEPVPAPQSRLLSRWYSISLDNWGVELQRSGRLPEARHRFEQALALNTNNWVATINLQCNTNLQAGNKLSLAGLEEMAGRFKDMQQIALGVNSCGPFDEPVLCFLLGRACQQAGWPRQAVQHLERAKTLAPGALPPELSLAELYSRYRMDDKVFEIVKRLRTTASALPTNQVGEVELELSLLEARTWMSQTNPANARRILQSILQQHPNDTPTANVVFKAYLAFGDLTNALQLVAGQLASEPDNIAALNNQAAILIQLNRAADAIPILNRALAITNSPAIRLNRAIAYMFSTNLPAAEADYRQLENLPVDIFSVHYGLAQIAEQRHDTNLAIHHFAICLSNVPPGTVNWEEARMHLEALRNPASHDQTGK